MVLLGRVRRGFTLAEVLVAVVFLAICASSILACVTTTSQRIKEVAQREQVLGYTVTQIETLAASIRRSVPTPSTTVVNATLNEIPKQVSCERKVELVSGTSDLYLIDVKTTWTATSSAVNPTRVLRLTTYVRSPYG